jgi:hypothetical protein
MTTITIEVDPDYIDDRAEAVVNAAIGVVIAGTSTANTFSQRNDFTKSLIVGSGYIASPDDGTIGVAGALSAIAIQDRGATFSSQTTAMYGVNSRTRFFRGQDQFSVGSNGVAVNLKLSVGSETEGSARFEVNNGYIRVNSGSTIPPASGKGLELAFDEVNNIGYVFGFNRDTVSPCELRLGNDSIYCQSGGSIIANKSLSCASGFVYGQRAKAAVLASSVAVNSGRFQLTDSGLEGRCVYPDGTNWRYEHDNSIVS